MEIRYPILKQSQVTHGQRQFRSVSYGRFHGRRGQVSWSACFGLMVDEGSSDLVLMIAERGKNLWSLGVGFKVTEDIFHGRREQVSWSLIIGLMVEESRLNGRRVKVSLSKIFIKVFIWLSKSFILISQILNLNTTIYKIDKKDIQVLIIVFKRANVSKRASLTKHVPICLISKI